MVSFKYQLWMVFAVGLILAGSKTASAQLQCDVGIAKGVCVNVPNCPWLVEFLKKWPQFNTSDLIILQCGVVDGKIAVCCSNGEREDPNARYLNQIDISNHPNLDLLPSSECGPITNSKLLGTDKLSLAEMPWMALLIYETSSGFKLDCEGSIINNRYILTVALCIAEFPNRKLHSVVLGDHDTKTDLDCETPGINTKCNPPILEYSIEKTITHKSYKEPPLNNNIGLIRLAKPIIFDQAHIQPVCLPTCDRTLNFKLKELLISGWGRTPNWVFDNTPSKAHFFVQNMEVCRAKHIYFRFADDDKQFCAHEEGSENSCRGTSGSSLVYPLNSNGYKYFQLGMLSVMNPKCDIGPGIYLKIQKYMDWILDNIEP